MGGDKQVTTMVLKVDLQCYKCYKKIKKILCQFPQIQDQVYDEKQNIVIIKVICCSPEKIKQKIKCKGGDSIKSIEIKIPEKHKDPPKPIEPVKPKDPPKPKEPEKPKDPPPKPKEAEKPKDPPPKPKEAEKPKDPPQKPKVVEVEKVAPPPQKPPAPAPAPAPVPCVPGFPQGQIPFRTCCTDCMEGRPGGPCYYGCGPPRPPPCYQYDGYYGRPVYDSYGGGRSYYASRCDYFSDENSGACAIM